MERDRRQESSVEGALREKSYRRTSRSEGISRPPVSRFRRSRRSRARAARLNWLVSWQSARDITVASFSFDDKTLGQIAIAWVNREF